MFVWVRVGGGVWEVRGECLCGWGVWEVSGECLCG